jgi:hypothetical protein
MRCLSCGEEMRLVQICEDKTKSCGYERHTYECSGCRDVVHRPVFNEGRKGPIRRNVRIIVPHPKYESSYAAQDAKSGMVIMLHQDRSRLRELCEWMGWRVVDGAASSSADTPVPDAVSVEASDARLSSVPQN